MSNIINYVAMGERIRRARENARLTQWQLADICFLSAAHMGHIERGSRLPSLEAVFRISKALNISMDYLISDSLSSDEVLLNNISALLRSTSKVKPKTLVLTVRAIADKMDEA
ncbi:MAG: helix-turn-helix domain-containing protein [Oscillospiraceae bacterium]|nr:helix-turn-helix domain-containing protein [Oscillospiraceae bacterium]